MNDVEVIKEMVLNKLNEYNKSHGADGRFASGGSGGGNFVGKSVSDSTKGMILRSSQFDVHKEGLQKLSGWKDENGKIDIEKKTNKIFSVTRNGNVYNSNTMVLVAKRDKSFTDNEWVSLISNHATKSSFDYAKGGYRAK